MQIWIQRFILIRIRIRTKLPAIMRLRINNPDFYSLPFKCQILLHLLLSFKCLALHLVPVLTLSPPGKELLYFLYTGHVRPSANAQELLAAAAMYEIQELVHYCVQVVRVVGHKILNSCYPQLFRRWLFLRGVLLSVSNIIEILLESSVHFFNSLAAYCTVYVWIFKIPDPD